MDASVFWSRVRRIHKYFVTDFAQWDTHDATLSHTENKHCVKCISSLVSESGGMD